MKKTIKKIVIFVILFGFFLLFNSGLRFDSAESVFQSLIFALLTLLLILHPRLKKVFIVLSLILFVLMVIFFVLNFIPIANFFGSLAFGILIISGLFYLPKVLKKDYI